MVDASNILRTLDDVQAQDNQDRLLPFATEITTAHLQISHADVIIINKIDLVTPQQLEAVKQRIYSINGLAHVVATSKGKVPRLEGLVLDLSAYDEVTKIEDSKFSRGGPANHLDPVSILTDSSFLITNDHSRLISALTDISEQSISTVSFPIPTLKSAEMELLDAWMRCLLWDGKVPLNGVKSKTGEYLDVEIHRLKGRVHTRDGVEHMIQGVREVFEIFDAPERVRNLGKKLIQDAGIRQDKVPGKIVLIGRGLYGIDLQTSFELFVK